ncbi:hypothetical protein [Halobaculum magnesiiphilum]|uniref:Uncharacterized protein n=1 Tax=Halobaculum magnesiiphilum TaxID=1017351 RepID=A0A8T8WD33_9EURY|nr:hypothetical protein [Halobaculum magnesiiphilum]QZP37741.1 hypothetical protein K6T50_00745 [Halobaculum magnesiiphilum]
MTDDEKRPEKMAPAAIEAALSSARGRLICPNLQPGDPIYPHLRRNRTYSDDVFHGLDSRWDSLKEQFEPDQQESQQSLGVFADD